MTATTPASTEPTTAYREFREAYETFFANGSARRVDAERLYDLARKWERCLGIVDTADVKRRAMADAQAALFCRCGHLGRHFEGEHRTHDGHCGAYVGSDENERCDCIGYLERQAVAS